MPELKIDTVITGFSSTQLYQDCALPCFTVFDLCKNVVCISFNFKFYIFKFMFSL